MNDLISRRAAIDAICEDGTQLERDEQLTLTMSERKQRDTDILTALPSVNLTAYGYPVNELMVFADACRKAGIDGLQLHDFVLNAKSAYDYGFSEFTRTCNNAMNQFFEREQYG